MHKLGVLLQRLSQDALKSKREQERTKCHQGGGTGAFAWVKGYGVWASGCLSVSNVPSLKYCFRPQSRSIFDLSHYGTMEHLETSQGVRCFRLREQVINFGITL